MALRLRGVAPTQGPMPRLARPRWQRFLGFVARQDIGLGGSFALDPSAGASFLLHLDAERGGLAGLDRRERSTGWPQSGIPPAAAGP
jgi:hypothetical protein